MLKTSPAKAKVVRKESLIGLFPSVITLCCVPRRDFLSPRKWIPFLSRNSPHCRKGRERLSLAVLAGTVLMFHFKGTSSTCLHAEVSLGLSKRSYIVFFILLAPYLQACMLAMEPHTFSVAAFLTVFWLVFL